MKNQLSKKSGWRLLCKLLTVGCAGSFLFVVSVRAVGQKVLDGQVPAAVKNLSLQPVATLAASNHLHLAIGLPLRDSAGLDAFLREVYTPGSPDYHHYLTPAEFAEAFGPSAQDYQAVIDFARTNGLTITEVYSNRMVLGVSGSVANIQSAFHTTLGEYQHPTENRKFYAPETEPAIDARIPILHVQGLDNYTLPRSLSHKIPYSGQPLAGSAPGGGYMGQDFRNAYAPGVTLDGSGQIIGLLQFDGYDESDISTYENIAGLPSVPLENVLLDGFDGSAGGANGEVCLDIEASMSMAPGISKIVVFEGLLPDSILSSMASHSEILQFSASWGYSVDDETEQLYKELAVQGQTFFNASGDGDAWVGGVPYSSLDDTNITLVGGTTLTTIGSGGYASEKVWNWGYTGDDSWNPDGYWGSSGGISTDNAIPPWQADIDMTQNGGSTTMRNMPDVALTGDNVFVVSSSGQEGNFGGTSCASPLWVGFMALVNQQIAENGGKPIGFLNPTIYEIAQGDNYTNAFHDIVLGDNTWPGSPNMFYATNGYDLCTGLGTPNGINMINALAGYSLRNGVLQLTIKPPTESVLLYSSTQMVNVSVDDVYGVTNATVMATIPGIATNMPLLNESGGSVYTNSFVVPSSGDSLTMTVMATDTNDDEVGVTNIVNYYLASPPANDNFKSATKVSGLGGVYLANNRLATIETNEPAHNGDVNQAGSLWWAWSPAANTNVLINTMGSKVENVLAVYTGSALAVNMAQVASAGSALSQSKPAQVSFNAQSGTTYFIAVASVNTNSLGTIGLRILPGDKPDTNAPTVSVISPLSGLTVTSRILNLAGTASDSMPGSVGLSKVSVKINKIPAAVTGTTNWTAVGGLKAGLNFITAQSVDAAGNTSPAVSLQVNYLVLPPVNDFFSQAISLTNTSGTVTGDNTNATKEIGEPNHAGNGGGKSIWWSFTPAADGVLTLDTTNSTFDTLLAVYTGGSVANLTPVISDDDAYDSAPGGFSYLNQALKAGVKYYIAVDGYNGDSGDVSLTYSFVPTNVYYLSVNSTAGGVVLATTTNLLGGTLTLPTTSGYFAAGSSVTLTALSNANAHFDVWNGSVFSLDNPLTMAVTSNLNLTANFVVLPFTDGFESGNLSQLSWATSGSSPWFVQTNVVDQGQYAAQSGPVADGQTSSLILSADFAGGTGSFDYKVSSEQDWATLGFYVDGILQQQWSGNFDWANYAFTLTAGDHTLKWTYTKNSTTSAGLDAAFIDDVNLPIVPPVNDSSPAQLQLKRQTDGTLYINLSGQTNQQYIIQVSTNLIDWQNIGTNVATGGFIRVPLLDKGTNQAQFYRAVVP